MSELLVLPKRESTVPKATPTTTSESNHSPIERPTTTQSPQTQPTTATVTSSQVRASSPVVSPTTQSQTSTAPSTTTNTVTSTQPIQRLMTPEELEAQAASATANATEDAEGELGATLINTIVHYDESEDYEKHSKWSLVRDKGFRAKMKWFGYKCANGADRVGAVLNSFFGVDDNNYQYVLDAAERMEAERREREAAEQEERTQAAEGAAYLEQQRQDFEAAVADVETGANKGERAAPAPTQRLQGAEADADGARLQGMLYGGEAAPDARGAEQKRLDAMLYGA